MPPLRYEELKVTYLSYYPEVTDITDDMLRDDVHVSIQ